MDISVICKKLEKYNPALYISEPNICDITEAEIYEKNALNYFDQKTLMIFKSSEFSEIAKNNDMFWFNAVCLNDIHVEKRFKNQIGNLLIIDNNTDITNIFRTINSLLENEKNMLNYSLRLYELYYSNQGLKEILTECSSFLGNPVFLDDADFKLLEFADNKSVYIDNILNDFYIQDPSSVFRGKFLKKTVFRMDHQTQVIKMEKYNRIVFPITYNFRKIAQLTIFESDRSLMEIDHDLISIICNVISLELQKDQFNKNATGFMYEYLLLDLLEGWIKDCSLIGERLLACNWKLKRSQFLLTICLDYVTDPQLTITVIRNKLQKKFAFERTIIYDNNILAILSTDHSAPFSTVEYERLSFFLRSQGMYGGLSRGFEDLNDLKTVYQQTTTAVELGIRFNKEQSIFSYEDYAIFHMMDSCISPDELIKICNPAIFQLMEFDHQYNTFYTYCLYVYLKSGGKNKEASDTLNISPSTLVYRMNKIRDVIGKNLNDEELQFELLLSFKILEYLKKLDESWNNE